MIGAFFGLCAVRWRYKTPCLWVMCGPCSGAQTNGPNTRTTNQQHTKQEKSFTQQYSHMYTHRLKAMRPLLAAAAQAKWGGAFPVVFWGWFNGSLGRVVWVDD